MSTEAANSRHHSIRRQLSMYFTILTGGMIFLCWFANAFLLEKYYIFHKQRSLYEVYDVIEDAYANSALDSEEFELEMRRLCNINNMNFIVTDSSSNTLYTSINNEEQFNLLLRDAIFSRGGGPVHVLEEQADYTISIIREPATNTEYLTMWGDLEGENFFMIRTALESIRESAALSSGFLLMVGGLSLLLAIILTGAISRRITRPLSELAEISRRMTELDFDTKYRPEGDNEITRLGENMNRMSETLEETISDLKTANLELQKDVEARQKADERRAEFIGNVSHELKTPIALIQGYAEGLKDGISDDQESRDFYCDVILDETHKMNHLVKRLIALSQFEEDTCAVQMTHFNINELIEGCIQSFEQMVKQEGITVIYTAEQSINVWGDEYQVEEVLRNYFSNAVHYCSGKKEIRVRTEQHEGLVRICVFNSGKPIPEESLERIWEKFYKVDKARTREYGGSGLGLSIVKAIMDSLHQKYGVKNYEDGVEFWFELATK